MGRGKSRFIWTEPARLQVIHAVMKVELEIARKFKGRVSGRGMAKWDRIIQLLPPELRQRTWNNRTKHYNQYKCGRLFYDLLNSYGALVGRPLRSKMHLTDEEFHLLRKREAIIKARESGLRTSKSQSLRNNVEGGLSDEGELFGDPSLKERSEEESESLQFHEVLPPLEGELDGSDSEMSVASEDGLAKYEEGVRRAGDSAKVQRRQTSRPAKPSARSKPQAQTRARPRALSTPAKQPAKRCRAWRADSQSTSPTHPSCEESLDEILDGPLRCVDRDFSHLSSWVETEAAPVGRAVVNELTSAALGSGKRRKCNTDDNGPFHGLMCQSSVEIIENRIRALFHKLRIRVAAELKRTCADIAQEPIEAA